MKLEETLQLRDQEITGAAASKGVLNNPEEEKKATMDSSEADIGGTANF